MKFFIKSLAKFAIIGVIPFLLFLLLYVSLDPFKVIYKYDSFYEAESCGYVGINKEFISSTTFENNRLNGINYDSFIFGNSRSIFYQVSDWETKLPLASKCFHFDASGESVWGLNNKIMYIDSLGTKINNALIIIDYSTLFQDKPRSGHLFITSPLLTKKSNYLEFHITFFKAFLSPIFLYAYLDFKINGKIKPYMREKYLLDDTPIDYQKQTNEVQLKYFEELIEHNQYYDSKRLSFFYSRDTIQTYSQIAINKNQRLLLENIHNILTKQKTKFKIVISPLYDQKKLNSTDLSYLANLFGADNVFDFSGINEFTNDYRNYYENSHYRPHIAKEIINIIYSK